MASNLPVDKRSTFNPRVHTLPQFDKLIQQFWTIPKVKLSVFSEQIYKCNLCNHIIEYYAPYKHKLTCTDRCMCTLKTLKLLKVWELY